jgi:hypothetical protein
MQLLKETSIDWHEKKLIIYLYMGQSVKVQPDKGEMKCEDWKRS